MRKFIFLGIIILILAVYNSNAFQSLIMTENYYTPIFDDYIDVNTKGAKLKIPISNKYNCLHGLFIAIPGRYNLDNLKSENGTLYYQFTANDEIISEGTTYRPERKHTTRLKSRAAMCILEFELPFRNHNKDVFLKLEVREPMLFLKDYSGNTTCLIRPISEYK